MTGTLEAPASSHALPPLSYYFPYKYGRDAFSWDVQRKKQNLSVKRSKSGFLIGNSKLVLTVLVSELPTSYRPLENLSCNGPWSKAGSTSSWRHQLGGQLHFPAKWLGLRFLDTCNVPASAGASKWPVWFYPALIKQEKNPEQSQILPNPVKKSFYLKQRRNRQTITI